MQTNNRFQSTMQTNSGIISHVSSPKPGIKSRNGDMFVYSAYWRNWSRIISPMGGSEVGQVEVDLTAINPTWGHEWERVRKIKIRAHWTRDPQNWVTDTLPDDVYATMCNWIGDEALRARLLHEDLLPLIDWRRFNQIDNGGAYLDAILRR